MMELQEAPINMDELNCSGMVVVDTFLLMYSELYDDYFLSIYGINDWKYYGRFISRGRGEDECMYISFRSENQEDSAKIWIYDNPKIKVLDVIKSVRTGVAVFDRDIHLSNSRLVNVGYWYRINDSVAMGQEDRYDAPKCNTRMIKYDWKHDTILARFDMYNNKLLDDYTLFFGAYGVKEDGSKIVNSMLFFDQLNFYDFSEKKGFSVSRRGQPIGMTEIPKVNSAYLQSYHARDHYYVGMRIAGDKIFASYCKDKDHLTQECSEIHVFNWEGEFLTILKPVSKFKFFEVDRENKNLYLYRADEKLYVSDLEEVFRL